MDRRSLLLSALAALPAMALPARAQEGPVGFDDRPGTGHPVIFRDETGGIFRPRRLSIITPDGVFATRLPDTAEARSEERLDLSGIPFLGGVFQDRRAPSDVAREGELLGTVYRQGEQLILDAAKWPGEVGSARVLLTANLPGDDAISMDLGRLSFARTDAPPSGPRVGAAYIFKGALVIAADGGHPLITDWGIL